MIFIDSNIPMYLIGNSHPNKQLALHRLETLTRERQRLVTSAEVFQEIMHRYSYIKKPDLISVAFDLLEKVIDDVFSIELEDVKLAGNYIYQYPQLSARDCLHVAVMKRHEVKSIFTFDRGFDIVRGIKIIE